MTIGGAGSVTPNGFVQWYTADVSGTSNDVTVTHGGVIPPRTGGAVYILPSNAIYSNSASTENVAYTPDLSVGNLPVSDDGIVLIAASAAGSSAQTATWTFDMGSATGIATTWDNPSSAVRHIGSSHEVATGSTVAVSVSVSADAAFSRVVVGAISLNP